MCGDVPNHPVHLTLSALNLYASRFSVVQTDYATCIRIPIDNGKTDLMMFVLLK